MEMFDVIYYITLLFIPVVPYFLLFKQSGGFSTHRDWLYHFRLLLATPSVKKYQKKCKVTFDENARKIQSDIHGDNHFIYGVDQKGNSLSVRFTLRSGLVAEVFLCLRLARGGIYTFPGGTISKLHSISKWNWKTKDLNIEILEPFKRLRVVYNGLLTNANKDVEHVKFHFLWVAAGPPQFYPQDASTALLADALARETWRDGDWITLLGDEKGYEQFGALRGFVKGDSFADDLLLNLPSCRTRFWGTSEKISMDRTFHLFVAGRDGALISLWVKALRNGCKQLQFGNIIMSDGATLPISESDVRLDCIGPHKSFPEVFIAHIHSQRKLYRIVFHLNPNTSVSTVNRSLDYDFPELSNITADCDINTQQGRSLIEFWYRTEEKTRDHLPQPLLRENNCTTLPTCYVSSFEDENSKIVRLVGGKGCSLAMLTSLKSNDFIVPNGFVVTVNSFNKQLDTNFNLKKAVAILEDICYGRTNGDLEQACLQTVETFQTEEILPEIRSSIIDAIKSVKKIPSVASEAWAVRSSAIGEDSEELSAAGQNETFLGCRTTDDVLKSVSSCWASLFTYQSVQYRHKHGLPVSSQMAVVVQRMVPADCAGVLFTCHPSTGNPAQIVITANHGLGESVVSGRSEPDTVILERSFDNDLRIKSKTAGSKQKMIKMTAGGVQEVEGNENFSINENQALELGKVGILLEEKFGSARDIEWGYYEGRLFLLQSRPVTTLCSWSNYELSREFDAAVLCEDSIYTTANIGEVLPGASSVLTLSSVIKVLDQSIQRSVSSKEDPYALKCMMIFQHHLFLDVVNGIHRKVEKKISLMSKILDLSIFGHPVINDTIHSMALSRFGIPTRGQQLNELLTVIRLIWDNEKHANNAKELARNTEILIDKDRDNLKDIYNKIDKALQNQNKIIGTMHCLTTRTSVTYQFFAMMVLAENGDDLNVDHHNDAAMLLASCENVVSAEIPEILANITRVLVEGNKANEFVKIAPEDGREWLRRNAPEARKMFDKFLEEHGHRALREFDIAKPNWSSNPSDVIKMIQTNCKTNFTKAVKVSKPVDEVIAGLVSPKKPLTRPILKYIMKKSRKAVGLREHTKSETVRFVNKIRVAYRYLSQKMALAGLIPHPELIYHLSHYEVGQIIGEPERHPALITKALKRQKLYPKWDQLKFPELSCGIPRHESRDPVPRTGTTNVKCEGTPVCTGTIQARACVITDLAEIDQLQDGDVLITYCTDIGWSPYFPMLGGIVTELGGLVSHGAVIAREYGLPCIVGVKGVTRMFQTGDNVILSGKTGTIELV